MQGPIHTAAEWAQIARETKGQDLWSSHTLTHLSLNRIVLYNERGDRCPVDSCRRWVEYRAYSFRRGRNGHQPSQRTVHLCPKHAQEFAEIYGLDWPCRNEVPDELPAADVIDWRTHGKRGSS
jgi:hypothetical protein